MNDSGQLPKGWVTTSLNNILLPAQTANPVRNGAGEFTYIDIDAVDNVSQRVSFPRQIPNANAPSRARNAVRSGDVIFSLVRPYLKNIAVIPSDMDFAVASTAFIVCRPAHGVNSSFLLNYFRQTAFISSIPTYGNSPPAARDDEFTELSIPLPPSPEQTRIADALDELFSDLDAGVAALERARAKLKLYRASLLKAAVEGNLTAEWREQHPEVEPASELLKRILVERRKRWEAGQLAKFKEKGKEPPAGWKSKYKEPVKPDTANLSDLPRGWCWVGIAALSSHGSHSIQRGPFGSTLKKSIFVPSGYQVYEQQHAISGDCSTGRYFITREKYEEMVAFRVSAGDIIISCSGTIGKAVVVPVEAKEGVINQALLKVTLNQDIIFTPYFLLAWASRMEEVRRRGTGMMNLSGVDDLKLMGFPLPSLDEQAQIIEAAEEQLSLLDHLESEIDAKLRSAQALRQSILRHAFSGKLVPQDPNDEPASELLKRIAKERGQRTREATSVKRTPKKTKAKRI